VFYLEYFCSGMVFSYPLGMTAIISYYNVSNLLLVLHLEPKMLLSYLQFLGSSWRWCQCLGLIPGLAYEAWEEVTCFMHKCIIYKFLSVDTIVKHTGYDNRTHRNRIRTKGKSLMNFSHCLLLFLLILKFNDGREVDWDRNSYNFRLKAFWAPS
jgi:hypothetical protein